MSSCCDQVVFMNESSEEVVTTERIRTREATEVLELAAGEPQLAGRIRRTVSSSLAAAGGNRRASRRGTSHDVRTSATATGEVGSRLAPRGRHAGRGSSLGARPELASLSLACSGKRPYVQPASPSPLRETQITQAAPSATDLPLIRAQSLGEICVRSMHAPVDLEQQSVRQRTGLDRGGLRRKPNRLASLRDGGHDRENALNPATFVRARLGHPRDACQVSLESRELRPSACVAG